MPALPENSVYASLPAPLLYAAAQFCKKYVDQDSSTEPLSLINLKLDGKQLVIRATNGTIAFRCRLDADQFTLSPGLDELQVPAEVFTKPCAKADVASFKGDAVILGTAQGITKEIRPIAWRKTVKFPNLDQCWPDSYSYDIGATIGLGADLLHRISGVIKKISPNGHMKFHFNTPNTPVWIEAAAETYLCEIAVEVLLMPVVIRDHKPPQGIDTLVEDFNAKPAEERDGLSARANPADGISVAFNGERGIVYAARTISQALAVATYITGQ
jgi:hypothetical protein